MDYVMKTERFEPKIYKDGNGIETIGYGFTDKKLIKKYRGKKMSEKEARRIFLEEKVPEFTRYVADKTENFDKLSDSQKDALFSFVYNVGVGNYEDDYPKLHKALVDEDWMQVAQNMDAGYFDEDNPGLRLRRNYERELFGFMSDENGNVIPPLTDDQKADKIQNTLLQSILGIKNDVQLEDRYASTFNEAYKAARKRGDRKFTWGGKEYSAGKYAEGGVVGPDDWTSEDLFNPAYSRQSHTASAQNARDEQFKRELEEQRIKGFTDYIVPAMTTVADFTPVVGEVKSGMEALRLYTEGHPGEAALASLGAIPVIGLASKGGKMIGKAGKRSIMPYVRDIPKWLDNLAETTMFPKKLLDAGKWALAEAGDNTGRSIVDVFPATPWAKEIADNASMNAVKRGTNYVEDHYSDPKVQEKIRSVLGDNGYVISSERREALRRAGVIKGDGIDSIDYEKYKEQIPVKIGQPSVVERADHSGYYLPIEEGGEVVVYDRIGPYRRPANRIAETAAHENNHLMQDIYGLDNWQVRKDGYYVPNTDTEVGRMFEKVMNKTPDDSWYRSPSELHSSIMEYRLSNGIKPGEELSDKAVDEIYRSKKFSKFFDSNAKEEDVKKLIKILPSIAAPAAYSVLSEDDSFSEGGFVGDNYDIAYDYLVGERNLSPKSAIAIMANLENESGMDPSISNSIGAFGLQQWLGPRKKALIKRYGYNPNLRQQLEFLVDEYEGRNEKTGWNFETKGKNLGTDRFNYYMYSKADFDNAPTIEDATIAWNQGFGRPATHELNNEKRIKSAQRLARRYNMPYLKGSYGQLGVNMDNVNKQDVDNFKKDIIGSILPGYVDFEKYDNKAKLDAYVPKSSYAKKVKERSEKVINQQDVDRAKMDFFNLVWNSISFDKIKR